MLALFRLIDVTAGRVLLDGVDVATIGLDALRRQLAIIPQAGLWRARLTLLSAIHMMQNSHCAGHSSRLDLACDGHAHMCGWQGDGC